MKSYGLAVENGSLGAYHRLGIANSDLFAGGVTG
jgi:hypothetical protein